MVSSNWENDYVDKLDEYQRLGIKEYWIVDYLAIGSRDILGEPKFPTVSIYTLNSEGIYERQGFQGEQGLISVTFPELSLTAQQLFETWSGNVLSDNQDSGYRLKFTSAKTLL